MAYWVTIFCKKSLPQIDTTELLSKITTADFTTLAEGNEMDEDLVDKQIETLRFEPSFSPDFFMSDIHYGEEDSRRPLILHHWSEPEDIAEVLEEKEEWLDKQTPETATAIKEHFQEVVEIIAIELGFGQLEDAGILIADEIARYLAVVGDGIIEDGDNYWSTFGEYDAFEAL